MPFDGPEGRWLDLFGNETLARAAAEFADTLHRAGLELSGATVADRRPSDDFGMLGFDPAPGDAERVAELAERYRRLSIELENAEPRPGSEHLGLAVESTALAAAALDDWTVALRRLRTRTYRLELEARSASFGMAAVREAARRLLAEHTEAARDVAEHLGRATDLVPGKPIRRPG